MSHINRITTSAAPRHQSTRAVATGWNLSLIINSMLACGVLALVLAYVVQANAVAAQTWRKGDAQAQLAVLRDQRNTLVAQAAKFDDRAVLEQLAHHEGMISAGAVVYLVQDREVAAR